MHAMVHWWADADCCLYVGNVAALSQCYGTKSYMKGRWFCFKTKLSSLTHTLTFIHKYSPTPWRIGLSSLPSSEAAGSVCHWHPSRAPCDDLGAKGLPGRALLLPGWQPQAALGGPFAAFGSCQWSVFPGQGSSGLNHCPLPLNTNSQEKLHLDPFICIAPVL